MTMIERYLGAVKSQLPRAQQDDIIAELSENIQAQMDDEAGACGRPLDDDEQAAILKRFGNPLVVAARYRGDERSVTFGRRLIGPELFPTYLMVLTINMVITLVIGLAIFLGTGGNIGSALYGVAVPLILQFTIVTGLFVLMHRRFASNLDRWDPRTVRSSGEIDYGSVDGIAEQMIGRPQSGFVRVTTSALEFGIYSIFLVWWVAVGWVAIGIPVPIGFVTPGPGWADLYVPVALLIAASLVPPVVNMVRPRWTRFRVVSRAVLDGVAAILMGVSLALGSWVLLADPATATVEQSNLVDGINLTVGISLVVGILVTGGSALLEARRLLQMRAGNPSPTAPERP